MTRMTWSLPCLHPAEQTAFTLAEHRAVVRGVDAGPATTAAVVATVRRLAHILAEVERLAQAAYFAGATVDPEALFAAIGLAKDDQTD